MCGWHRKVGLEWEFPSSPALHFPKCQRVALQRVFIFSCRGVSCEHCCSPLSLSPGPHPDEDSIRLPLDPKPFLKGVGGVCSSLPSPDRSLGQSAWCCCPGLPDGNPNDPGSVLHNHNFSYNLSLNLRSPDNGSAQVPQRRHPGEAGDRRDGG